MKKIVELPIAEPLYSTYHYQGLATAIISDNPSIRNWYLNKSLMLQCNRRFLRGFTTPEIGVSASGWADNPCLVKIWNPMHFLRGYTNMIVKRMLDEGYYVYFSNIDDYYVEGKTWYRERHFCHDGCICGYNDEDKTFCIYAYDKDWIYKKFWTPQKSFDEGRKAMFDKDKRGILCAVKPKTDKVEFSPDIAIKSIGEYLDSSISKYPENEEGVSASDTIRILYASHHMKRRDSVLPIIQKKLLALKELEKELLSELLNKTNVEESV